VLPVLYAWVAQRRPKWLTSGDAMPTH
jgi:hypothetical protein